MNDPNCEFCQSPFRCEVHEIPKAVEGEPLFRCLLCNEEMLGVDCIEHSNVHIQEAVMVGDKNGF